MSTNNQVEEINEIINNILKFIVGKNVKSISLALCYTFARILDSNSEELDVEKFCDDIKKGILQAFEGLELSKTKEGLEILKKEAEVNRKDTADDNTYH